MEDAMMMPLPQGQSVPAFISPRRWILSKLRGLEKSYVGELDSQPVKLGIESEPPLL